jgi:hypothetical protein
MPTATSIQVDTGKVAGRRALRFSSPADLEADVARLVEADRAGRLTCLGNWSLGQALNHLGTWASFAFEPNPLKPPFFVRWVVGLRKDRYLNGSMPAGVRIPRVEGGTIACEPKSLDEGLARFDAAWARLKNEVPTRTNALFGPLTHQEWINLQLRHAELHLSFFKA